MCTPTAQMPDFLSNVNDNTLTFKTAEALAMIEKDTWGQEGALGWNLGMRWGTAMMFVDFASAIQKTMSEVVHPFLILHDPEDQVCDILGSRMLVERSQTLSEHKQLIEVNIYIWYISI